MCDSTDTEKCYLSGATEVNKNHEVTFPLVTICLNSMHSKEKLLNYFRSHVDIGKFPNFFYFLRKLAINMEEFFFHIVLRKAETLDD